MELKGTKLTGNKKLCLLPREKSPSIQTNNPNLQNNVRNMDENRIEVLETIDDAVTSTHSPDVIFPSAPLDNAFDATEVYKDSREHQSIMKFVAITFLFLFLSIFLIIFIRTFLGFNLSTVTKFIIVIMITIFLKLFRTFMVIFSSIYCFELIRSLFSTIINETIESFQLLYNRVINCF